MLKHLALASLLVAAPFAGTSSAVKTCAATATGPILAMSESRLRGTGTFACADAVSGMTVTVCIDELSGDLTSDNWLSYGCTTTTASEATRTVKGAHSINIPISSAWFRTTVTATNDRGDTATAATPPTLWVNCACVII